MSSLLGRGEGGCHEFHAPCCRVLQWRAASLFGCDAVTLVSVFPAVAGVRRLFWRVCGVIGCCLLSLFAVSFLPLP